MKLSALLSAISLGLIAAGVHAATEQPQVNLYIWGEYMAPDTLSSFEEKPASRLWLITSTRWKPSTPN